MKAFAFVLLCVLAAVQGRYHELPSSRSSVALGDAPYVVHLRIAVSTSGLLNSCVGSLIESRFVLTSANCVANSRFIWIRYGAVNVVNPSLVTETSAAAILNAEAGLAVVNITRYVEPTENYAPISLGSELGDSGKLCLYGGEDGPGEQLNCYEVDVAQDDDKLVASSDEVEASEYDIGAPLVSNGAQVGVLVGAGSDGKVGEFVAVAPYSNWIEAVTGVRFSSEAAPEAVKFVQ